MGLESATHISDLVSTNPLGSDAKSTADDHIRLLKSTIKTTFPNITGAVTVTHTQINSVTGKGEITGQTWSGTHTFPATTYGVTASVGDSSTKFATTAFVAATAFSSALPAQTGNADKLLTTDGSAASWTSVKTLNSTSIIGSGDIAIPNYLVLLATLTPTAAANVDFLTTFTSDYDNYLIIGQGILVDVADSLRLRFAVNGVVDSGSFYTSISASGSSALTTSMDFSSSNIRPTGVGASFTLMVCNCNDAVNIKLVGCDYCGQDTATTFSRNSGGGGYVAANAISGVRVFFNGGNNFQATGKIRIYGIKNS